MMLFMSLPFVWVKGSNHMHKAIHSTPTPTVPFLVGRDKAPSFMVVRAACGWLIRFHPKASAVLMVPESAMVGRGLIGGFRGDSYSQLYIF